MRGGRECEGGLAGGHGGSVQIAGGADGLLVLHTLDPLVGVGLTGWNRPKIAQRAHPLELLIHLQLSVFIEERKPPFAQQQHEAREVESEPDNSEPLLGHAALRNQLAS
jgi:hypothetical protein